MGNFYAYELEKLVVCWCPVAELAKTQHDWLVVLWEPPLYSFQVRRQQQATS